MSRDERQDLGIERYRQTSSGGRPLAGTLNHATGFGKTTETKKIIDKIKEKLGHDFNKTIVVPTSPLQKQWEDRLDEDDHQVLTIQSIIMNIEYYKKNKIKTFFLVIDEIHKFAADKFQLIFEVVEYDHILGLTATWERLDGKENLIAQYCPIVDIVTLEEARRNGWVADFIEYCYGVEFNNKDREAYAILNRQVEELMPYFNGDYDTVIGCCSKKDRRINGKFYKGAATFIEENPDIDLYEVDIVDGREITFKVTEEKDKVEIITKKANICRQAVMSRKEYTDRAECKIEAALEVIHYLNVKTVTFGTVTSVCDKLTERLGNKARSYHTKVESQIMNLPNSKGILKPRKIGKEKVLEMYLKDFADDKFQVLNTAKKADLGLDIPRLRGGVILARTSDPGTHDQRKGRIVRDEMINVNGELVVKEAIIVNIYVKGTKDESSLKWLLKKANRVRWINNVNEIKL